MKLSRNKLRNLIESILSEGSSVNVDAAGSEIQQMIKSILVSRGVDFDASVPRGIKVISGDYLGRILQSDVEKLGSGGLESIINTVNKKFNTDVEIIRPPRPRAVVKVASGGPFFLGKNGIKLALIPRPKSRAGLLDI